MANRLLDAEALRQESINALGCCVSAEALRGFDTDGGLIQVGPLKLTARGCDPKRYQTSRGGLLIVRGATPRCAS